MANLQKDVKQFFEQDNVKSRFAQMLGEKRATQFVTSILQIVASNDLLSKADPASIYHAAATAATLDLPLNNNLGFAYIVPYNQRQKDGTFIQVAQFQLGYKGFIQLAQRSGQFKKISAAPIYEGQLTETNPLTGHSFDFSKKTSETIIGYASYFELINGFSSTLYMTMEELNKHGVKYSQTYKKGFGLWKDNFDAMASKTVLKLLLAKYAPLSVEMQKVVVADQGVVKSSEGDTLDVDYVDHQPTLIDKPSERIALMIADCTEVEQLEALFESVDDEHQLFYNMKMEELKGAKKNGTATKAKTEKV